MADIFKTIFEAEPQFQRLLTQLDDVNKKYGESTIQINKQQDEITALLQQEKRLLDARSKAQNPNMVVKINKELELTKKKIIDLNIELRQTATANQTVTKTAREAGDKMGRAFAVASITAAKKEIQEVAKETRKISDEDSTGKVTNAFTKLRQELKAAKGELAEAQLFGDPKKIQEASDKVDELKDRLQEISLTGSRLERIPLLFRDIAGSVASLDFAQANKQSKALLDVTKSLTFKEAISGVGQLGETLFNVGKALLLNPIFLIGAAVLLIVQNFDALQKSGGLVGKTFRFIGEVFEGFKIIVNEITDALGLTTVALDKLAERQKLFLERSQQLFRETNDFLVAFQKAQGKQSLDAEVKGFQDQKRFAQLRIKLIEDEYKRKGLTKRKFFKLFPEEAKLLEELQKQEREAIAQTAVITEQALTAARNKVKELNKDVAEERAKSKAFDIEFKLKPLSKAQIQASFALQREALERNRKDEIAQAELDFEDVGRRAQIISLIESKYSAQKKLLVKQEGKEIIDARKQVEQIEIDIAQSTADAKNTIYAGGIDTIKTLEEARLEIISANTKDEALKESQKAEIKLDINKKYYASLLKLNQQNFIAQTAIASTEIQNLEDDIARRKQAGLDVTVQERELAAKRLELDKLILQSTQTRLKTEVESTKQAAIDKRAIDDALLQEQLNDNAELLRDENLTLKLRGAAQSRYTLSLIHESKRTLDALKAAGQENTKQYRDELAKKKELDKQYVREAISEYVGYYDTVAQAAFTQTNQVLAAKEQEVDGLIALQQKRIDEVQNIADKGNAEMLEAEEKRLDDLNKKKEKFVRAQQALATVELISNTAVMVSKAAAETGVAAAAGIAAALLALIGGLASARALAGQAAFYKGGEFEGSGFTGNGNPVQESKAVGSKPYIYHKREFIFDHYRTNENLDIFRRIHRGQVNLREWESKVKAYDGNKARFNMAAEMHMNQPVINNIADIKAVEAKLDGVIKAIQSQPGMKIQLTREGVYGFVTAYEARQDLIKDLAGGK